MIFIFFIFSCCINVNFSYELSNQSVVEYSLDDSSPIQLMDDVVYFDANALVDGDGTENNPYKYINSTSLDNCSIAYLKNGEYVFNSNSLNIKNNLNIIGEDTNNTIINNIKINNEIGYILSFYNVMLTNPKINTYGILNIESTIISNSDNPYIISKKNPNSNLNSQININNSYFYNLSPNNSFINAEKTNIYISNSNFYNNSAKYCGGVITGSNNTKINIKHCIFTHNKSILDEGGVFYLKDSELYVDNSSFINSYANFGGAICNLNSKTTIKNTLFKNNTAKYDGDSIYNMYSTINITQSTFKSNNIFFDNSTINIHYSNFTQSPIIISYENDVNIDNTNNYHSKSYFNPSLEVISETPIYYNNASVGNLSKFYDGREHGLNTSVKNQENGGFCWAFAALSTLESCLLKINNANTFDFSEENMKNIIAKFSQHGLNKTGDGGSFYTASGYLTGWFGPTLESDDPYCPKSTLSPTLNPELHIQNIYIIPKNNITLIKEAICKYGAVYYNCLWNEEYLNQYTYNYNSQLNNTSGHALSIIGWDDDYSKDNFKYKPQNNGAWIAKNSHGNQSGENGYIYISYENNIYTQKNVTFFTFILNDTQNYNHIYQYDIACISYYNNLTNIYLSNNFTSSRNEVLSAVSTYFLTENINYEVIIKINDNIVHTQNGFMKYGGYYTIPLTNTYPLVKGDKFDVIIHLYGNQIRIPFCTDSNITHILYPKNSSKYSFNNQNWIIFDNGVVCIKAFTIINKTETTINSLENIIYTNNNQNQIIFAVKDRNNISVQNGTLIFSINNSNYTTNVVNGLAIFNNIMLSNTGPHTSKVYYIGNIFYKNSNITYNFINKEHLNVDLSLINPYYGQIQKLNIENPKNITITTTFNNNTYTINNSTTLTLGQLNKGNYSILINYDNENYYIENNHYNFTVLNETYLLISQDLTKYYKGAQHFYATLIHTLNQTTSNKTITININGEHYIRTTNENGTVKMIINLSPGQYNITTTFNEYNITQTNLITIKSTIQSNNVVKIFKNQTQYYATFLDTEGNPLNNTEIQFNINGVFYNRTTNISGRAKLNINLSPGEYIITAFNPVNDEMKSNNITVLNKIESSDLTKYYRNNSQFIVRLIADNGSYVNGGEKVKFNINGVIYNRTTNETGHAKLNINLIPGEYIITTEYQGCNKSNHIKVLSILTAEDLTMYYRDGSKFIVHLVDGQGIPYPNQTVNFNINGVFYNRVTDSSGQAKLNINLMAGEYIITSSYGGSSIANTITIYD